MPEFARDDGAVASAVTRIALIGNPNTGKTTIFNRLSGLRHRTANFPGTTQESRVGMMHGSGGRGFAIIDLPGVYSLELEQGEAEICRSVLAGEMAPRGEPVEAPDAVCVVIDAGNLARGLALLGESLRRRLPTVVALNMIDLVRRDGVVIDARRLAESLGCPVIPCSARTGEGIEAFRDALGRASIPVTAPPADEEGLARWADEQAARVLVHPGVGLRDSLTDRLDRVFTHPVLGLIAFAAMMAGLFWAIFSLAVYPMDWIEWIFAALGGGVERVLPEGLLRDLLAQGVVSGVAGVVVFLPQICVLFFLISLLEDTGYLARAAFVMDRALRPFGLPGHAFVPLLSCHACAIPGIMATRGIPDRRERLATILVAPFMTCSARLPVYVLVTNLLFPGRPLSASLAFVAAYALGAGAGVLSALVARRTILRGPPRPMILELPTYKWPSIRTALLGTYDRALVFLKQAGTNILAICVILWWLGAYPRVEPPAEAVAMRAQAAALATSAPERAATLEIRADRLEVAHQGAHSFMGRIGSAVQPLFEPLGYDRQLTIGVLASFAAREVFVSTMAVVVAGETDAEHEGVMQRIASAKRDDGVTPVFTRATCWSLLVYFVLAMQCLPTLAVTAREAGGGKWALVQMAWMTLVAYGSAFAVFQLLRAAGVS